jgi:hypothetical protein
MSKPSKQTFIDLSIRACCPHLQNERAIQADEQKSAEISEESTASIFRVEE